MMNDDEEFLRDLMETFRQEAEEHIRVLSGAVVDLETAGEGDAAQRSHRDPLPGDSQPQGCGRRRWGTR